MQYLETLNKEIIDSLVTMSCGQRSIPDRDAVDRTIRYEVAGERGLSKALDRLETLQRRRRGEAPPPQLNVNISYVAEWDESV